MPEGSAIIELMPTTSITVVSALQFLPPKSPSTRSEKRPEAVKVARCSKMPPKPFLVKAGVPREHCWWESSRDTMKISRVNLSWARLEECSTKDLRRPASVEQRLT